MKTVKNSKVTEADRSLLNEIVAQYGTQLAKAFKENPAWQESLSHLGLANIRYHLAAINNRAKGKTSKGAQRARQEQTAMIRTEVPERVSVQTVDNNLNYCPCCGFDLAAVKNVLNLMATGKL